MTQSTIGIEEDFKTETKMKEVTQNTPPFKYPTEFPVYKDKWLRNQVTGVEYGRKGKLGV